MWMLVFVATALTYPSNEVEPRIAAWYGGYTTMSECFFAREKLGYDLTGNHGYFPEGTQAICIRLRESKL